MGSHSLKKFEKFSCHSKSRRSHIKIQLGNIGAVFPKDSLQLLTQGTGRPSLMQPELTPLIYATCAAPVPSEPQQPAGAVTQVGRPEVSPWPRKDKEGRGG